MPPFNTPPQPSTQEERDQRGKAIIGTLLLLRQKFLQAFVRLNDRHRPALRIGIHDDVISAAPELDPIAVQQAIAAYVGHFYYRRSLVVGAPRFDLSGKPAGVVTASEAEHAARMMAEEEAKRLRRKNGGRKPLTLAGLKAAALKRKASN